MVSSSDEQLHAAIRGGFGPQHEATVEEPAISLDDARRKFSAALNATSANDTLALRDRRYFDGDQLDNQTRRTLRERGQPAFVTNQIAGGVNGVLGLIDAGDCVPEALPRSMDHQDAADAATKTLREIADTCHWDERKKGISKEFVIEGTGVALVTGEPDKVSVEHIHWNNFFNDPNSRETDFRDARYLGIAKWFDADDVAARYPEAYKKLGNPFDGEGSFSFDAKENEGRSTWMDTDRRQLRVVEMYYLDSEGQWHLAVFCRAGFLEFGPCPYVDDQGNSVCPIVAASYEIDSENNRYGMVRNMISPQDEINAHRSRLLHLSNSRQVKQTDANPPETNAKIAKREAARPDGAIPFGWEPIPTSDKTAESTAALSRAYEDLARLAPTPAVLGRVTSSGESGRARQMLQQAGYMELARAISRYEDLELRIYKQMWFRARQFWSAPRWVRATTDPRTPEWLQINEPVLGPPVPQIVTDIEGQPVIGPDGQPQVRLAPQVIGYKNHLAQMDMDIIVTRVENTAVLWQESFAEVVKLAQSTQMDPFDPRFLALIEISDLPNARQIVEKIEKRKKAAEADMQAQQQMAAQAQQTQSQVAQAKAAKDMAHADKASAEADRTKLLNEALIDSHLFNRALGLPPQAGI